jgi:hypothetical protein
MSEKPKMYICLACGQEVLQGDHCLNAKVTSPGQVTDPKHLEVASRGALYIEKVI